MTTAAVSTVEIRASAIASSISARVAATSASMSVT